MRKKVALQVLFNMLGDEYDKEKIDAMHLAFDALNKQTQEIDLIELVGYVNELLLNKNVKTEGGNIIDCVNHIDLVISPIYETISLNFYGISSNHNIGKREIYYSQERVIDRLNELVKEYGSK